MDMSELHCTCAIGTRCERNDNREVQYVINMTTVEIDSGGIEHMLYDFVHGEYDSYMDYCTTCDDTGYASTSPIIYCECVKGCYYEGNIEGIDEILGYSDWSVNDIIGDDELNANDINIEYLQELPLDENMHYPCPGDDDFCGPHIYNNWLLRY